MSGVESTPRFTFGEVNIFVTDLESSLDFYTRILGFELLEMERGCAHLKGGGQPFLLLPFAKSSTASPAYGDHPVVSFDLYVKDAEAAYAYCLANKVTIERDLDAAKTNFFIRDPDGLVIEVVQDDFSD